MNVISYNYNPKDLTCGIVHIGVGNFHRAHQAFYFNDNLSYSDQSNWAICGVSLLPSDEKIVKALRAQNLDYTVTVCGRDGRNYVAIIGAIQELIWAVEDPEAVIKKMAEENVKIVSLTITEGGYNLSPETGEFNFANENIQYDLAKPAIPKTIFGFVAEALRRRKHQNLNGFTILSCDNLQHNGNTTKKAFMAFLAKQDESLANWAKDNITFPNSMVDRITPATTADDVVRLNKQSGIDDNVPVYSEDFIQWVIEDNFVAGRPSLEQVGVQFTRDVTDYENMKLSLLNASHTLLSYPSVLKGYRKVDEAMRDPEITKLVRDFMDIDITPYIPAPEGINLREYKQTLIERFANQSVSDQLSRLCFDGLSKFPVYIIPNLAKMLADKKDLKRLAFLVASYRHYLKYKTDDKGTAFDIAEPWLTEIAQELINSNNPQEFLDISVFKAINLKSDSAFVEKYLDAVEAIKEQGVTKVLSQLVA